MLNKVQLIGNLGKDPEVKTAEKSGKNFTTFSIATEEVWKDENGEKKKKTEWHNIIANGKIGELSAKYLKKGSKVYVEGKLRHSEKKDKDGNTRKFTNINIDNLEFLSAKPDTENTAE